MKQSKKYTLSIADAKSIGITIGLAIASYAVTQLINFVPQVDFGSNSEMVSLVILAILKGIQKFIAGK